MKIKRSPVVFYNVLSVNITTHVADWHEGAKEFRNRILMQGFYATGPTIFQVQEVNEETEMAKITFSVPINEPVELDNSEKYNFQERFYFEDTLVIRHADLDEDINEAYELLTLCAQELNLNINSDFYNIYLDVYGDGFIDVFIPIVGEIQND